VELWVVAELWVVVEQAAADKAGFSCRSEMNDIYLRERLQLVRHPGMFLAGSIAGIY